MRLPLATDGNKYKDPELHIRRSLGNPVEEGEEGWKEPEITRRPTYN